MNTKRFSTNRLALALAAALVGGGATNNAALAVDLENTDRLGDAAVFQYYTAKGDWQTFFRLINTSEDAIVVKVRFREAANSREALDFEVALSPHDMWSGWTDSNATGTGAPGIRTSDTSCTFPIPGNSPPGEGFDIIDADTNLVGALFKDRAFTGIYDDNAGLDSVVRLSEGHIEVIGVAKYDCGGSDQEANFCQEVTHNADTGKPNDCAGAENRFFGFGGGDDVDNAGGDDMDNVLAANAYLVNIPNGQGAGYDPDIFENCADRPLELEAIATDTNPDLDSCTASFYYGAPQPEDAFGVGPVAYNQRLSDGSLPPVEELVDYQADLDPYNAGPPPSFGDGSFAGTVAIDLNGDGVCDDTDVGGFDETAVLEADVPQSIYAAAQAGTIGPYTDGGCDVAVLDSGGLTAATNTVPNGIFAFDPWRIKQKGLFNDNTVYAGYGTPVTGGVDDVSREIMRTSVINEWAAAFNPAGIITDYFTQWVLTFPTKHYYVDLQDDANPSDDISPTLVDTVNLAFSPFLEEFDEGTNPGKACEPFYIDMWNREERFTRFTSPAPSVNPELCYETNVVTFNERYEARGLASSFTTTVPAINLPREINGDVAEKGWAELVFTGEGAVNWGLSNIQQTYYGLPVTGFMLSIYNTGDAANNYTSVNAHKYTREVGPCTLDEDGIELCFQN